MCVCVCVRERGTIHRIKLIGGSHNPLLSIAVVELFGDGVQPNSALQSQCAGLTQSHTPLNTHTHRQTEREREREREKERRGS